MLNSGDLSVKLILTALLDKFAIENVSVLLNPCSKLPILNTTSRSHICPIFIGYNSSNGFFLAWAMPLIRKITGLLRSDTYMVIPLSKGYGPWSFLKIIFIVSD